MKDVARLRRGRFRGKRAAPRGDELRRRVPPQRIGPFAQKVTPDLLPPDAKRRGQE